MAIQSSFKQQCPSCDHPVTIKDADLVGIPFRINVGKKVTEDTVEVVQRSTRQSTDVKISAIGEYFHSLLPHSK